MHVVKIQLVAQKTPLTVLTHIIISTKDVVTRKSHFERKHFAKGCADNESWRSHSLVWRADDIIVILRLLSQPVYHFIGLVIAVHRLNRPCHHHDQRLTHGDDVDSLIITIEY